MTAGDKEILREVDDLLKDCLRLNYLSVGIELQEEAIDKLESMYEKVNERRKDCIKARSEAEANLAWIACCYLEGMKHFMRLWVHCKRDQMESAWDALVSAQERFETGLRLRFNDGFFELNRHLYALERLLFPSCVYVSSSFLIENFECSICGTEYGECDHVAMNLYMGEMCVKVVQNLCGMDHIAIVSDPEDKRLRFPARVEGRDLCSLTYRTRVIPEPTSEPSLAIPESPATTSPAQLPTLGSIYLRQEHFQSVPRARRQ